MTVALARKIMRGRAQLEAMQSMKSDNLKRYTLDAIHIEDHLARARDFLGRGNADWSANAYLEIEMSKRITGELRTLMGEGRMGEHYDALIRVLEDRVTRVESLAANKYGVEEAAA